MKRVGFTGTQRGMSAQQKVTVANILNHFLEKEPVELHHGDCLGADDDADSIASSLGISRVVHPPSNSSKRAWCKAEKVLPVKPYLERNHDIVDAVDVMIATPGEDIEQLRSGTWATIRYARKSGRELHVVRP